MQLLQQQHYCWDVTITVKRMGDERRQDTVPTQMSQWREASGFQGWQQKGHQQREPDCTCIRTVTFTLQCWYKRLTKEPNRAAEKENEKADLVKVSLRNHVIISELVSLKKNWEKIMDMCGDMDENVSIDSNVWMLIPQLVELFKRS